MSRPTETRHNPLELPPDLPSPPNDGAATHLPGAPLPILTLSSTSGRPFSLPRDLPTPAVLFFYPRTGIPNQPPNLGFAGEDWDTIPGARGCTPQSCGFRDLHAEFLALGVRVYGVSTNTTEHHREFIARNHVPYEMLSDSRLDLVLALHLPTFEFPVESGGPNTLTKRMAWYIEPDAAGVSRITHVWYPVFPPDRNAATVLAWLKSRPPHRSAEPIAIRATTPADLPWVREELTRHWLGTSIASRDVTFRADQLPALIAQSRNTPAGLLTYQPSPAEWEVITLSTTSESRGTATALLAHAADLARAAGARRIFLTTSNDNLHALGFYQKRGWRLAAIHKGAMDRARLAKPDLPAVGLNGIPVHDELELELPLRP